MNNITKIHDLIWIFHNALPSSQSIIDYWENNKEWDDWYTFGTMIELPVQIKLHSKEFPTPEEWSSRVTVLKDISEEEGRYMEELLESVYKSSHEYFQGCGITLPSYYFPKLTLARYNPGGMMQYHTDFIQEQEHMPGFKFHTTCLFYLNDDYEGGEINFAILNENKTDLLFHYEYKPKKGDLIIFPSGEPFYHGVNVVESGRKYIIRAYWQYMKYEEADYNQVEANALYELLKEKVRTHIEINYNSKTLKFNTWKKDSD